MSRICPKCAYQRRPTDTNPEWQCPSCHVAYNKVIAPGDLGSAYRTATPYFPTSRPQRAFEKGIVIAGLLVTFFFAYRHYSERSSTFEADSRQPEIVLYGTASCVYCRTARDFFAQNGIEYVDLDIEKSVQAHKEHQRLGGVGVPVFVIEGQVVHGWREDAMRHVLEPWMK